MTFTEQDFAAPQQFTESDFAATGPFTEKDFETPEPLSLLQPPTPLERSFGGFEPAAFGSPAYFSQAEQRAAGTGTDFGPPGANLPQLSRGLTRGMMDAERGNQAGEFSKRAKDIDSRFSAYEQLAGDDMSRVADIASARKQAEDELNAEAASRSIPFRILNESDTPFFQRVSPDEVSGPLPELRAGASNFVASFAEMFKDPLVLSGVGLGKAAPVMGEAIGRAFGMQMLTHSPEQVKAIYDAYKAGDTAAATEAILSLGATAYLGPKLIKGHGSASEQFAKVLQDAVENQKFPEPLAPVPIRELGIPQASLSAEPFLQPGIPSLADAALREAGQRIIDPGADAIGALRREIEPPQIEPVTINRAERLEGGGEAPYGKTSFMREAERTQEVLRQEAQPNAEPILPTEAQAEVIIPETPVATPKVVITEAALDAMPLDAVGKLNHPDGIRYGLTLAEADIPRLEQKLAEAATETKAGLKDLRDAKTPEAEAAAEAKYLAGFGKNNFYGGALAGVTKGKHTAAAGNYELYVEQQGGAPAAPATPSGYISPTESARRKSVGEPIHVNEVPVPPKGYVRDGDYYVPEKTVKPERGLPENATQSDLMADMTEAGRQAFREAKAKPDEFSGVDATNLSNADRRNLARLGLSFVTDRKNRVIATYPAPMRARDLRAAVTEKQPPTPKAPNEKAKNEEARVLTPETPDLLQQISETGMAESTPKGSGVRDAWDRAVVSGRSGKLPVEQLVKGINEADVTFNPKSGSMTIDVSGYATDRGVGSDLGVKHETITVTVTPEGALRIFSTGGREPRLLKFAIDKAEAMLRGDPPTLKEPAALPASNTAISKLESLKFKADKNGKVIPDDPGQVFSLPHPDAIKQIGKQLWNDSLSAAQAALKQGRTVAEAIEVAFDRIRFNAKDIDPAKVRANLAAAIRDEGMEPRATAAATPTARPATTATLDDVYKIFEPDKKPGVPLKQRAINIAEGVRTGFSSKFRPVNKLAEDIAKAYGTTTPKDIAGIMEQLKGSQGKGEAQIYRFDQDVSKLVKGEERDFNAYMFLRRSVDRLTQDSADIAKAQAGGDVPTLNRRAVAGYTLNELNPKLATLEAKLGPEKLQTFQQAAEGYQRFMDDALRLQVESGRMSPEVYAAIKEGNQFYAPFKVMKYLEENSRPPGTGRRIDTTADFTKAMVGIEDPNFKLGDMLGAARQSILMSRVLADKNMAMRHVAELSPFDTDGQFIRKLTAQAEVPKGWEAVNVLERGKEQRYAVRPEVAEAIQLYGVTGADIGTRLLSVSSVPFRAGATAFNIPFQVSNLLADVPRQALVSKFGPKGVVNHLWYPFSFAHSMFSSMKGDVFGAKNQLMLDFLDSGVAGSTVQEYLTPNALKFQEPSNITKSRKLASTVLNTLPNFAKAIEQSSKVQGVKQAMKITGAESGAELARKFPEAITELRRFSGSPDFGRTGKVVEQYRLNLLYMFLNARIQGTVADVGRLLGRDGAKTAGATWFKIGTAVGIPTAYLYALNHSDEYKDDYAKRSKLEKDNYWLIPKDSFITTEDGEKLRDYWRIPKRESSKWIANMTESALNFAKERDPKALARFGVKMLEDISPVNIQGDTAQQRLESIGSSLNPILKAPLELATGRDMYRHRELVPESMQKASPEKQFTTTTPEAFKKLAELMPDVAPEFLRSPIILDNLTRNLTAGLITQFLPRKPVQGRSGIEQNPLMQRFQALPFSDNEEFKSTMKELERESANESLDRHRTAMKLLENGKGKSPDDIIGQSGTQDIKLMRHIVDLWVAKENGATMQDRQILALPIRQRAAYVAQKLKGLSPEKQQEMIQDLARKRIFTEAVAEALPEAMK